MEDTRSAGQKFWDSLMAKHPTIKGILDMIKSVVSFLFEGHIFVWVVNWLIRTAGRIAESVLMLGTLWITSELVAGKELNAWIATWGFIPNAIGVPTEITTLCVMAFSLIPEIILLSAIVTTFRHWWITFHQQTILQRVGRGVWAGLYTVPTLAFIILVYITFQKLTSVTDLADLAKLAQAGTDTIQARVLAGWFFSMIELIYPIIMKSIRELEIEQNEKQIKDANTPAKAGVSTEKSLSVSEVESLVLAANKASEEKSERLIQQAIERVILTNKQLITSEISGQTERHFNELSLQNERHIESLNQQLAESLTVFKRTVSVTLEETTASRENKPAQPALKGAKRVSSQIAQKSEGLSFDRKQFVYECLKTDINMSATTMRMKAKDEKQTLSVGSVSKYRAELFEEHPELSLLKNERQNESPVEQEDDLSVSEVERRDTDQLEDEIVEEFEENESLSSGPDSDEMPAVFADDMPVKEPVLVD